MERAPIDGVELEYEVRGTGEPVVLMHAGVCADFFAPLLEQPALADRYSVVGYHRTGYAGSVRLPGWVSFAQQASHCRALMRHLGIERAHVVGHSSSASMALQLALDAPDVVHSLALLDPARPAAPSALDREMVRTIVEPALERHGTGDKAGAVDTWMRGVCGPNYRAVLEQALPGAFDQAVADADTFFGQELPAVLQWSFGPQEAARIAQPALAVLGENSHPVFRERRDLLLAWLPNVESFELPEATHLLQVQNPRGMAEGLAAFFARNPLPFAARPARRLDPAGVGRDMGSGGTEGGS
jgi:pimeloyl-ACP methyl ester carboxylesterase